VLDASNEPVAVYRVTQHDLSDPAKFEALQNLLIAIANVQ
jgi:hypothetical protein